MLAESPLLYLEDMVRFIKSFSGVSSEDGEDASLVVVRVVCALGVR